MLRSQHSGDDRGKQKILGGSDILPETREFDLSAQPTDFLKCQFDIVFQAN